MNIGNISIFVLVGLAFIISFSFHYKLKNFFIASALSTIIATTLHQLIGYVATRSIDPLILIAIAYSLFITLIISVVVGIPFAFSRNMKRDAKKR